MHFSFRAFLHAIAQVADRDGQFKGGIRQVYNLNEESMLFIRLSVIAHFQ
jgi:hypothetical protein